MLNLTFAPFRNAIPRWLRRSTQTFSRQHVRRDCAVIGEMRLVDSGIAITGLVHELSCGGCSFRTASKYMLVRTGEPVAIVTEYLTLPGRIRATRPEAYGVQFLAPIEEDIVIAIAEENPRPLADAVWPPQPKSSSRPSDQL